MTREEIQIKQDAIREGIANRLVWWKDAICRMVENNKNPNADSPMTITKLILQDLVDAGVVIKVDKDAHFGMVAVEPLIEEGNDT